MRYPSDLRDGEWALIEPMFAAVRRGGRPRTAVLRDVMDAILYIASSGCTRQMLPKCFPPVSTARGYFYAWRDSGLLVTINQLLVMAPSMCSRPAAFPFNITNDYQLFPRSRLGLQTKQLNRPKPPKPHPTPPKQHRAAPLCVEQHLTTWFRRL